MTRLILAAGLALCAAPLFAAPPKLPTDPLQREKILMAIGDKAKTMDSNGDGKLTLEEWEAAGYKRPAFDTLDNNKDGVLTLQEVRSNAKGLDAAKVAPAVKAIIPK